MKKLVAEGRSGDTRAAMAIVSFCARLFPEPDEADRQADPDEVYLEKLADRERLDAASKDPSITDATPAYQCVLIDFFHHRGAHRAIPLKL